MTDPTPLTPEATDELVSAVLDGEAAPDEMALVAGDQALQHRLVELGALSDRVGTTSGAPDGLADRTIEAALVHLAPATAGPAAPPVDEVAARRAAKARRLRPLLVAAAAVVVLAAGAVAVSNLDSGSQDTASAGRATDSADASKAGGGSAADEGDVQVAPEAPASESAGSDSDPTADSGNTRLDVSEYLVADDLTEFAAALRDETGLTFSSTTAPEAFDPDAPGQPLLPCDPLSARARLVGPVTLSGRGEIGTDPVLYVVVDTADGRVLVVTTLDCELIAERDL